MRGTVVADRINMDGAIGTKKRSQPFRREAPIIVRIGMNWKRERRCDHHKTVRAEDPAHVFQRTRWKFHMLQRVISNTVPAVASSSLISCKSNTTSTPPPQTHVSTEERALGIIGSGVAIVSLLRDLQGAKFIDRVTHRQNSRANLCQCFYRRPHLRDPGLAVLQQSMS